MGKKRELGCIAAWRMSIASMELGSRTELPASTSVLPMKLAERGWA